MYLILWASSYIKEEYLLKTAIEFPSYINQKTNMKVTYIHLHFDFLPIILLNSIKQILMLLI